MSARMAGPVSDLEQESLQVLSWYAPTVTVVAFLAVVGLVVVLARSSTARYEFERNLPQARTREPALAGARAGDGAGGGAGGGADGAARRSLAGGSAGEAEPGASARATAVAAGHPAGRSAASRAQPAWWLVDDLVDEAADQPVLDVVAGPFDDRIDAEWAALANGLAASVRPEHGVLRADGGLAPREPAQARAWLGQLGRELARLPEDWDAYLCDTDPLATLVVEVGAGLVEAGLPLYDCSGIAQQGADPTGGVCLTPDPGSGGIVVSWRAHDRMCLQQVRGRAVGSAVQVAMTDALGEVLARLGFAVRPAPWGGGHLVTGFDD